MDEGKKTKPERRTSLSAAYEIVEELNEDFRRLALSLTGAKLSPISWHSRPQQQV